MSLLVPDANGSLPDYRMGAPLRPDYIGLLLDHYRVEMDVLDRVDIRRGDLYPCVPPARDVRSYSPRAAGRQDAQGGSHRQRLRCLGA